MYKWILQERGSGIPISVPLIQDTAIESNFKLGDSENFKASGDWNILSLDIEFTRVQIVFSIIFNCFMRCFEVWSSRNNYPNDGLSSQFFLLISSGVLKAHTEILLES